MKKAHHALEQLTGSSLETVVFSHHAGIRMQQRGIQKAWVALLLEYGKRVYQSGKKTVTVSLDKKGTAAVKKAFGNVIDVSKLRRIYLILSNDSVVVTCAYRT